MARHARRRHVLAALLLPVCAAAQAPRGKALAIEDYYRLRTITAPVLSPDGQWVSFTVSTRIEDTNGTQSEVWTMPFDGSSAPVRRGTASRTADAAELTSPDGKWIATIRDTPPPKRERTFASDFEKRHDERFKGVQFDWMEFHRDGGAFPVPNTTDPQVTPPRELFLRAAGDAADKARVLTHLGVRPVRLQWSTDSRTLYFSVDSAFRNERKYGKTDVFAASVDGAVRRITPGTDYDYNGAKLSPDGKWILTSRQISPTR